MTNTETGREVGRELSGESTTQVHHSNSDAAGAKGTDSVKSQLGDEDLLLLAEYKISERVERRVYERLRFIAVVASAILGASGAFLGYLGAKQLGTVQEAAEAATRAINQKKAETETLHASMKQLSFEFTNTLLPETRAKISHLGAVENMSKFPFPPGSSLLGKSAINAWLRERFHSEFKDRDLEEVVRLFNRYQVTTTAQLGEVYDNAAIQARVATCYQTVLGRQVDPHGMFHKGVRMLRGGVSNEEILEELRDSDEYRAKQLKSERK